MDELQDVKMRLQKLEDFMSKFVFSDRYMIERMIQIMDGRNFQLGLGTGTKIGTSSSQKLGFWGVTPVDRPATVGDPSVNSTITGGDTVDAATIVSNFTALDTAVEAIIDRLQEAGIIQ